MSIRKVLLSLPLMLLSTAFAGAENEMQWFADERDEGYRFLFGQAESDFLPVMLSCVKNSGILSVSIQNYIVENEPPLEIEKALVTFYNSSDKFDFVVNIIRDDPLSDYAFENSIPYSEKFRSILQDDESFYFEIEKVALRDKIPAIPKNAKFDNYLEGCAK